MTSKQVYPFATQDGKAIPLDIINPKGVIPVAFTQVVKAFVIPDGYEVGALYSTEDSLVRFGNTIPNALVDGTLYDNAVIVPSKAMVTSGITPGNVYVKGLSASGVLYIQLIEKWAGLGLQMQYGRK
jgi:hypothetical protein